MRRGWLGATMGSLTVLAAVALLSSGCGALSSPPGVGSASVTSPSSTSPTLLDDTALRGLLEADIQDEYQAQALYTRVLADFGELRPFSNIVEAEGQHARSVAALFASRGWTVPASRFTPEAMPSFETFREACQAGWVAEGANIALYDSQLGQALPDDVRRVLQANRDASLFNHLPAFDRCR